MKAHGNGIGAPSIVRGLAWAQQTLLSFGKSLLCVHAKRVADALVSFLYLGGLSSSGEMRRLATQPRCHEVSNRSRGDPYIWVRPEIFIPLTLDFSGCGQINPGFLSNSVTQRRGLIPEPFSRRNKSMSTVVGQVEIQAQAGFLLGGFCIISTVNRV
uniref:Uncharacterized protein n=1 Tax=Candidatus Kentrum sp. MB TaxID=2138164 RepID=A0A450X562_9GAMM|nr:MAG: hypothetical protein BECKMB1821G_GA0114241_100844 [Candidatus Kentron sp. MB]VFK30685.1 MAG: hypothetical protein BECKMB1821I_GA0114274_101720 [Candidatus Kentron sp. MB]VFK75347.1 MAG: hypothetical protein BECKMB1821H_GA0114242_102022 [Candidatus Kentron sp. MB]